MADHMTKEKEHQAVRRYLERYLEGLKPVQNEGESSAKLSTAKVYSG